MRDVFWGGMSGLDDPMQVMRHFCQGGGPIVSGVLIGCKNAPSPYLPASCTASSCLCGVGHQNSYCLCLFLAGVLFVDAAFDVDKFKVGIWGPVMGGKVFHCSPFVRTQEEAE